MMMMMMPLVMTTMLQLQSNLNRTDNLTHLYQPGYMGFATPWWPSENNHNLQQRNLTIKVGKHWLTSCSNTMRRHVAATNQFMCTGEFL